MGGWWSSIPGKALVSAGLGVLGRFVTSGLVDEVLAEAARAEAAGEAAESGERPGRRRVRVMPPRLTVLFVLGLCLFSADPYQEVMKKLSGGLLGAAGWQVPATTALTRARRRLGDKPLELLFWRLASALSPGREPWSHICGLLAVAWDGTTVTAPASEVNITVLGRTGGSKDHPAHYPQVRLVTLIACGTRALLGAAAGPLRTGEQALAAGLVSCLREGMLLVADRGYYSWHLWRAATATRAHLLWRVSGVVHLPVARELPDGSWLSVLAEPKAARRRIERNGKRRRRGSTLPADAGPLPGITVRVIEFWIRAQAVAGDGTDGAVRTERYRMITTVLDWQAAPAQELAAGYAWRWVIETGFRELKTYLRGSRILRGRTPDLALQEVWASLVIYQAIRAVICLAAASGRRNPARLSFTTAMRALTRDLPGARTSPGTALARAETEILAAPVPERTGRVWARAVAGSRGHHPARSTVKGPISQHATYTITITAPAAAAPASTRQAQQPVAHETQPP